MRSYRLPIALAIAMSLVPAAAPAGPKRQWQTGTLVDAGRKHDIAIGGAASQTRRPANPGGTVPTFNGIPEVGTYVIETVELRLELEAMVPAKGSEFEREITVGQPVTFAIEKNEVYVKLANGREHRLRVVRKLTKPKD
jgi:hypothetical protein